MSVCDDGKYEVAWMDVPWRCLPVEAPTSVEEAENLNQILKDYLFTLEMSIVRDFKKKVYARKREDWFELFLTTFIFQVVLSESLEMSFYAEVDGVVSKIGCTKHDLLTSLQDKPLEMPWSTFGGLRSYSSREIAAHFQAINGSAPFHMSGEKRVKLGNLGLSENAYLEGCPTLLKGESIICRWCAIGMLIWSMQKLYITKVIWAHGVHRLAGLGAGPQEAGGSGR